MTVVSASASASVSSLLCLSAASTAAASFATSAVGRQQTLWMTDRKIAQVVDQAGWVGVRVGWLVAFVATNNKSVRNHSVTINTNSNRRKSSTTETETNELEYAE